MLWILKNCFPLLMAQLKSRTTTNPNVSMGIHLISTCHQKRFCSFESYLNACTRRLVFHNHHAVVFEGSPAQVDGLRFFSRFKDKY